MFSESSSICLTLVGSGAVQSFIHVFNTATFSEEIVLMSELRAVIYVVKTYVPHHKSLSGLVSKNLFQDKIPVNDYSFYKLGMRREGAFRFMLLCRPPGFSFNFV